MNITPRIEHSHWQDRVNSTSFYGEREALERSDFLRPLLPPADRKYITLPQVCSDGKVVSNHAVCANLKHGGVRIRIHWGPWWRKDASAPTREEIIDLSRRVLAEIQDQHQDRINAAPEGWPFPVWRIAA